MYIIVVVVVIFVFWGRISLPWLVCNLSCKTGLPLANREPPAYISWMLKLKVCTTTPSFCYYFIIMMYVCIHVCWECQCVHVCWVSVWVCVHACVEYVCVCWVCVCWMCVLMCWAFVCGACVLSVCTFIHMCWVCVCVEWVCAGIHRGQEKNYK